MSPRDEESIGKVSERRAPTITADGKRLWIYPERRDGPWARIRKMVGYSLILVYLGLPHLTMQGRPCLRVDVFAKKFYFFGGVFRLNDLAYVAAALILACLFLFWTTSLRGRLWCGFGCPQTVFIEWVIRPIEELLEGSAHRRRSLDSGRLSFAQKARKILKHTIFITIAVLVANNFLLYFIPPKTLFTLILTPPLENPFAFSFMAVNLAAFYLNFAWFREQFCAFLCPYARLQAIMIDQKTQAVSYDYNRGEPRSRKKSAKGDCIDCKLCVRVCPTGIDIRNGPQLECIQCLRCADACNGIMKNLKREEGLIRLASAAEIKDGEKDKSIRLRPWFYGAGFCGILLGLFIHFVTRPALKATMTRMTNVPISKLEGNLTGNMFRLRLENLSDKKMAMSVSSLDENIKVLCGGCKGEIMPFSEQLLMVLIAFDKEKIGGKNTVSIEIDATREKMTLPLLY